MILIAQRVQHPTTLEMGFNLYRYAFLPEFTWPEEGSTFEYSMNVDGKKYGSARAAKINVGPTGGQRVFTFLDLWLQSDDVTREEVDATVLELIRVRREKLQEPFTLKARKGRVAMHYKSYALFDNLLGQDLVSADGQDVFSLDPFDLPLMFKGIVDLCWSARDIPDGTGFDAP